MEKSKRYVPKVDTDCDTCKGYIPKKGISPSAFFLPIRIRKKIIMNAGRIYIPEKGVLSSFFSFSLCFFYCVVITINTQKGESAPIFFSQPSYPL